MSDRHHTREKIARLVKRNPHVSLREIGKMVHLSSPSNILYHVHRLEKQGVIQWQGSQRKHSRRTDAKAQQRRERGLAALRKMSNEEQLSRIEMVAAKAQGAVGDQGSDACEDVVRFIQRIRVRRLMAHKIG